MPTLIQQEINAVSWLTTSVKYLIQRVWNRMVDDKAVISRPTDNPDLITNDPRLINDFAIQIITLKTAYRITNGYIESAINSAEGLKSYLKGEYHLK